MLVFFWLLFFITLLVKSFTDKQYIYQLPSGIGLFVINFLLLVFSIFGETIVVDRFFLASKLTVYYSVKEDSWGEEFLYVKKFGFASEDTIKHNCNGKGGYLAYVDHDGKVTNCGEATVRTY